MKNEEMMQPLEEDELEEVSGGHGGNSDTIISMQKLWTLF